MKTKPQSATKIIYNDDDNIKSIGLDDNEDNKKNSITDSIAKFFMGESELNKK